MRIALIGYGRLGTALAAGWRAHPDLSITVVRRSETPFPASDWDSDVLDLVVLAVKPKDVAAALDQHKAWIGDSPLVSVAAGVGLADLESRLGRRRGLARAMPNICAAVSAAVTVFTVAEPDPFLSARLADVFGRLGRVWEIAPEREAQMDAVTALSGSGPAYVFEVLQALADAGEQAGLGRDQALSLAAETVRGAAELVLANPGHRPDTFIAQVASPGGTTEAALHQLRRADWRGQLVGAVAAAARRAQSLRS
jgi:pyrroline-5-carboxylate reductase